MYLRFFEINPPLRLFHLNRSLIYRAHSKKTCHFYFIWYETLIVIWIKPSRANTSNPSTECVTGDSCLKGLVNYWQGNLVIKGCLDKKSCLDFELLVAGYGVSLKCCSTDDCNSAGIAQLKISHLILSVLAAFIYRLF
jgi:hypothetical protein